MTDEFMIDLDDDEFVIDLGADLPEAPAAVSPEPEVRQPTQKQYDYAKALIEQRSLSDEAGERVRWAREAWKAGTLSRSQMSDLIDLLREQPYKPREGVSAPRPVPEGMHHLNGVIYKVQMSRQSGHRYAKVLTQDEDGDWTFQYKPGALSRLSEDTLLPHEEAARFGAIYGVCAACARILTDERSIHAGYGPVCAERHGWPWGAVPAEIAPGMACAGCEESDGEPHRHLV